MRGLSHSQFSVVFGTGTVLLVVSFLLSLYSVPDSADPRLPSFPVLELKFPLIPLLLILSVVLMSAGWNGWREQLLPLLVLALVLFILGAVLVSLSFAKSIPVTVGSTTLYIQPYAAQAIEVTIAGGLLAFFGFLFKWTNRRAPKSRA